MLLWGQPVVRRKEILGEDRESPLIVPTFILFHFILLMSVVYVSIYKMDSLEKKLILPNNGELNSS